MTCGNSTNAPTKPTKATGMSLFMIASGAETTLEHLERLVEMASERLINVNPSATLETLMSEMANTQTLIEAAQLYIRQMGEFVGQAYDLSAHMPKEYAE